MTDSPGFIHLRVHSVYSLKEGALHVKKLSGLCEALGFPALAVTDTNALFGALEFSECCARAGVQPVMGLQLAVAYAESAPGEKPVEPAPLALYAQTQAGWLTPKMLRRNSNTMGVRPRRWSSSCLVSWESP